jgi:NAD(P)-dependent dehydrogenase (short-subunit alcohol dehydrogenase family)
MAIALVTGTSSGIGLATAVPAAVAGCLSGLARFRRPGGRLLWQLVSRGRLIVDPDRLKASPRDARGVSIVPVATPHQQ